VTWIVTGGAGYIGAHVVHRLRERRHEVVVFDDLSTGRLDRLPPVVPVVKGSVTGDDDLEQLFRHHPAEGVIHLAACKSVNESIHDPEHCRRVNVEGVRQLLAAMKRADIRRLIFASSAAVYGDTGNRPADERQKLLPANPYGRTKREGESLVADASGPHLHSLVFRKFNVVGAGCHPHAVDAVPTNLLSAALHAVTGGPELVVRGRDYPTRDGSAVRDYIHVCDVADAYVRGVTHLSQRQPPPLPHRVVNLGSGQGTTVVEFVRLVSRATGTDLPVSYAPPRTGDVASTIASVARARRLHLHARSSLTEAVASAWESWQKYAVRRQVPAGPPDNGSACQSVR
jgi:UDP-glucose 4-epimerase